MSTLVSDCYRIEKTIGRGFFILISALSLLAQRKCERKCAPTIRLSPSEHRDFRGFLNSSSYGGLRQAVILFPKITRSPGAPLRGICHRHMVFSPIGKPRMRRNFTGAVKRSMFEWPGAEAEGREFCASRKITSNEETGFTSGACFFGYFLRTNKESNE